MFKFRYNFIFALFTTLGLMLASCSPAPTPVPITLTDGLNRTVTLQGPAKRVVSLAPSNTELLFEVGAGDLVVGCDDFSDFPAEVSDLPKVGGSTGSFDLDAIAALKPDLVLVAQISDPELVQSLLDKGLTVFYLKNPEHMVELYSNLQAVGTLTGNSDKAATLVKSLSQRFQSIIDKLPSITTHYKVYYELDATDPAMLYTAGPGSYIDIFLTSAGDQNIADILEAPYSPISPEDVIRLNPDFILLGDAVYGVTVESVMQRPGWSQISAVKNNRVFAFDDDIVNRPTARIVDAIEQLARLIHPEDFK